MSFRASCPHCQTAFQAEDHYEGKTGKCPKCNETFSIKRVDTTPNDDSWMDEAISEPSQIKKTAEVKTRPLPPSPPPESPSQTIKDCSNHSRTIIALLFAMLIAQLFGLTSTKTSETRWEYSIESPSDLNFEQSINRIGSDGWELVFARRASSEFGSPSYEMIFKRPKKN